MEELNGIELARAVQKEELTTKIIIFSAYSQPAVVREAIAAGASGYILKNSPAEVFLYAIKNVCGGKSFIDPSLTLVLMEDHKTGLSKRQLEILELISAGMTNKEIGQELFISIDTVKTHVNTILAKLDAHSRAHAVAIALRSSILEKNASFEELLPGKSK
jgi:DNA-binding NarL/FixJ family response regulator